jgi:hypothetical protein
VDHIRSRAEAAAARVAEKRKLLNGDDMGNGTPEQAPGESRDNGQSAEEIQKEK